MIKDTILDLSPECYFPYDELEQTGLARAAQLERMLAKTECLLPLVKSTSKPYRIELHMPMAPIVPEIFHSVGCAHVFQTLERFKVPQLNVTAVAFYILFSQCPCQCAAVSMLYAIHRYTQTHPELVTSVSIPFLFPVGARVRSEPLHAWFAANEEELEKPKTWKSGVAV